MTSLFPPCGPDCLKTRQLSALKAAVDANPNDPQALINYNNALYGPQWLEDRKQEIAKTNVEPILTQYRNSYEVLQGQLNSQGKFADLATAIRSDGGAKFLEEDYQKEKAKADVLDRLWVLNAPTGPDVDQFGILLYLLIAFLVVMVVALAYVKYRKYTSPPSFLGGNRLR